ncbi:MAG TPA: hypothetical protein VKP30_21210, partial [Polyangiaceae bacterium]|nr:hypothetical protein [Polyangiaceae bacterium]
MSALRFCGRVAMAGTFFLLARTSFAADPLSALRLEWEAPGTCPPRSAFERELRRDIAGSEVQAVPLRARVTMAQLAEQRFTVSIVVGRSSRQLEADTCSELVSAVSLIIATMIDPEGMARRTQAQRPKAMDPASNADATRAGDSGADATRAGDSTEVASSTPIAPRAAHTNVPAPSRPKEAVSSAAPQQTRSIPELRQDRRATRSRHFGYAAG